MYVITADQVDSRSTDDLVDLAIASLAERSGQRLVLPADRTAGDELQAATEDAATALDLILQLTRSGRWSVGCGIGQVKTPLPTVTRAASGPAFVEARTAVEHAKKRPLRFALSIETGTPLTSPEVEPLIDLLLLLRSRRSDEGWSLFDLLEQGLTQNEAAERLGITPQAVSQRAHAAQLRVESAALPALHRLLRDADLRPGGQVDETAAADVRTGATR